MPLAVSQGPVVCFLVNNDVESSIQVGIMSKGARSLPVWCHL